MAKSNKKTKNQYNFDEFEQQVILDNIVGDKRAIYLLQLITNRIKSGYFKSPPSLIITGQVARTLAVATAHSLLKSTDIRVIEGKYLFAWQQIISFFKGTNNSVFIILNPERMSFSDEMVYGLIQNRKYKFTNHDGSKYADIKIKGNGIIILVSDDIKQVQKELIRIVDFKIQAKKLTKTQIKKIIVQRLEFCKVRFDKEILDEIIKLAKNRLGKVIDLLKMSILLLAEEKENLLTIKTVKKAATLFPE